MAENLNLENFWDEMKEKYPGAMVKFSTWIDKYKAENDWNILFNEKEIDYGNSLDMLYAPKFHEIPYEMQFGILLKFAEEVFGEHKAIDVTEMKVLFGSCLAAIEEGFSENVKNKERKFSYGQTVKHIGDGKLYTICDLSGTDNGYYGMWPYGKTCAVPTHNCHEDSLEAID